MTFMYELDSRHSVEIYRMCKYFKSYRLTDKDIHTQTDRQSQTGPKKPRRFEGLKTFLLYFLFFNKRPSTAAQRTTMYRLVQKSGHSIYFCYNFSK